MKKIGLTLLFFVFLASESLALNLVQKETYFDKPLSLSGLVDYPPFSYYDDKRVLRGAFVEPTIEMMKNQGIKIVPAKVYDDELHNTKILLPRVRSGDIQLFAGAYPNTALFKGLNMLYPAVISNPIHVITLADSERHIQSVDDLKNLRGLICNTEYFNDFIYKKIMALNIETVDEPFEAYKKIILGQADYIVGSLYYHRMIVSRYGLGDYLSYSKFPIFKMPIFIAISKTTERLSLYEEAFQEEFRKPEYAHKVKEEIIRIMNDEVRRNEGIVPPSFSSDEEEEDSDIPDAAENDYTEFEDKPEFDDNITGAHIFEKPEEVEEKHIEDILDEI